MKSRFALALACAALSAAAFAADPATRWADGRLVAANGMTLYTFDKDTAPNRSVCNDGCLKAWPALFAADAEIAAPYSVFSRDDGSKQIALNGKPLYFFAGDAKAGDTSGDNQGGVWHVVRKAGGAAKAPSGASGSGYGGSGSGGY